MSFPIGESVTGRPRLAASEAKGRLGETHRRIFLSRDGGSSRARRPERPGRKEHSLNRLHTASGKYGSRTYTYDNNSNRATEVIGGGATYTYSNTASTNL